MCGKESSSGPIRSRSDYLFEGICTLIVAVFAACCLTPFVYVFFTSFMTYEEYLENPLRIVPHAFSLEAYKQILDYDLIHSGALVSFTVTVVGTALSVFLLVITAYPGKAHGKPYEKQLFRQHGAGPAGPHQPSPVQSAGEPE